MGREFELKYRAEDAVLAAIAETYGEFTPISMETTYYDTADRALSRLRWTLRRRLENGVSVCTLKTPAPGGGRGEWEVESPALEQAMDALCALGAPEALKDLTSQGIQPVCGARFQRLAKTLALPECTVELALDRGRLLGGNQMLPFAEVEVEVKSGSEEAAVEFASHLANRFGLIPEPASKYKRALSLTL